MSEQAEKTSIVIPAYNCETSIERCLASAFAQDHNLLLEVIVVDDGSTDGTGEILSRIAKEEARLQVIRQENAGVAAARNAGIRAAKGEWLMTLDADDTIEPEMLRTMYDAARRADAELAICGFEMVDEDGEPIGTRRPDGEFEGSLEELLNIQFLELYDKQLLNNQNNKLYRTDLIREHRICYDPAMQINEDLWFSLTYLGYCSEVAVVRPAFLRYTRHDDGESLVSRFHDNCVETCFAVLAAYDRLFNGCSVSDEIVNAMNNRMLFLICGYAGWQYYKSDYTDERMLQNIRSLCENAAFRQLLAETDPIGIKNRVAHFLLKRNRAETYHRLCKLIYRTKPRSAALPGADGHRDILQPETEVPDVTETIKQETPQALEEAAPETEDVPATGETAEALCEDPAEKAEEIAGTKAAEDIVEPDETEDTEETELTETEVARITEALEAAALQVIPSEEELSEEPLEAPVDETLLEEPEKADRETETELVVKEPAAEEPSDAEDTAMPGSVSDDTLFDIFDLDTQSGHITEAEPDLPDQNPPFEEDADEAREHTNDDKTEQN